METPAGGNAESRLASRSVCADGPAHVECLGVAGNLGCARNVHGENRTEGPSANPTRPESSSLRRGKRPQATARPHCFSKTVTLLYF